MADEDVDWIYRRVAYSRDAVCIGECLSVGIALAGDSDWDFGCGAVGWIEHLYFKCAVIAGR